MTLFMFEFFSKTINNWDGLRPPSLSISSIYYDLKWSETLYKIDNIPFSKRTSFLILKFIQIVAYSKGWEKGGTID